MNLSVGYPQDAPTLGKIDRILGTLRDGRVHDIEDLRRSTDLPPEKMLKILRFMAEFHLIMLDERTGSVAAVTPLKRLVAA